MVWVSYAHAIGRQRAQSSSYLRIPPPAQHTSIYSLGYSAPRTACRRRICRCAIKPGEVALMRDSENFVVVAIYVAANKPLRVALMRDGEISVAH